MHALAALQRLTGRRIPLAALAVLGCTLPVEVEAQTSPGACAVASLRGPATILRDGAAIPARTGTALHGDDQLVTGARSRLKVSCHAGFDITIGANTSVSMRAIAETGAASRSIIDMIGGILRVTLAPHVPRDRLELRTPTAVAAARSTAWVTEASAASTAVFVIAGEVAVSSRADGRTVVLPPGFGTDVAAGAAPATPARWGQPRAERALQRTADP